MLSSKKRRSLSTSLIKVLAILALLFVVLPFIALLFRIEWSNFFAHIFTSENWSAIQLTFVTSLISLLVALVVGLPLAFLMATNSAWKRLRAVMAIPLVLPPVVGGVLLLVAWGRRGVFGSSLFHLFGYSIPFTLVAVIFAQLFVALPIVVTMAEGAFRYSIRSIWHRGGSSAGFCPSVGRIWSHHHLCWIVARPYPHAAHRDLRSPGS